MLWRLLVKFLFVKFLLGALTLTHAAPRSAAAEPTFRAGAATVDVSPTNFPAIIAGGFLESQAQQVNDPLYVRCFAFDDGQTQIALAIVDTCMMPQSLVDDAKQQAAVRTGISVDHMLVAATHTHSAPAAMGCLGTRLDRAYAARLPRQIADAIANAVAQLQPARIGWAAIDDWEHTHNRRWIREAQHRVVDPFGQATGRAHMHPGYLSGDVIGPSGPVDPALTVLAAQTLDGKPLAVLANYSQHYFGAAAVSADYYGQFCQHMAILLGQSGEGNGPFVCAMSQGTSGDGHWMDYGAPQKSLTSDEYAAAVARYAEQAFRSVKYFDSADLAMVEKRLTLKYRIPSKERLAWARPIAAGIEDEVPKNLPEVYAREALILHERQQTQVLLQAVRIGDLTIAALPNEVYAITGLKLRELSPASPHFNIELANGAEGYIPPPEQHALGGYNTWPARTAGLEVDAEPKIVEALAQALEQVAGKPRRDAQDEHGPYAEAICAARPRAYWRLNDAAGQFASNAIDQQPPAQLSPGYAWYLPGVGSGTGTGSGETLRPGAFSGPRQINRAVHLAGGDVRAKIDSLGNQYSVAMWFWLGEASGASQRSGTLIASSEGEALVARQFPDHRVQLALGDLASTEEIQGDDWHFVVLVRDGDHLRVHLDGGERPEIVAQIPANAKGAPFVFGEGVQGKLDEIALFDRSVSPTEIANFWRLSGIDAPQPQSESTPADQSLRKIHVPEGFRVELVAAEPHVLDPVAFDWDAQGRLWVVEMADYPLGADGQGKPGGRVRMLEDRDADGRYETSRVFAEGLSFPNGILTWRDGVVVSAAPEILWLRDSNGDGTADQREVLIRGFHEGNQQLRVNGLRWGMDGWVYCANGGHHANYGVETRIESTRAGTKLELGSRDFRFQPDSGAIELESGPTQFGRNRDAWGHWFGTQNSSPLWHYVLPDRYSTRNPYVPMPSPRQYIVGPGSPAVFPASAREKRYHSFDQAGRFTSACGGMIYNDNRLFGAGDALHSFACEPFHNLVQHNVLDDESVSFVAHRAQGEDHVDFFASEDRWCRPVMVRTGPDGALWVADMYRYMIEHPDWLPEDGRAELLPHYRLGDDRGRIYRVVSEGVSRRGPVRLDPTDMPGLVESLDSPNDWQRDKAQQMLLWKRDPASIPLLVELAGSHARPETRLQALYTLDVLASLPEELLVVALADPHPRVRENALRIAEGYADSAAVVDAATRLADDPDAKVRMQLALSLGDWPASDLAASALARIAIRDAAEPFAVAAVMSSALPHAGAFSSIVLHAERRVVDVYREPLLRLAWGSGNQSAIAAIFTAPMDLGDGDAMGELSRLLGALQRAGGSWSQLKAVAADSALTPVLAEVEKRLEQAPAIAADDGRSFNDRLAAASLMCAIRERREAGVGYLSEWLRPQIAPERQSRVLAALTQSGSDGVPELLAQAWRELSPALREQALDIWLSRNAWAEDLLQRIESQEVLSGSLDPVRRDRLLRHPVRAIAERASAVLKTKGNPSRDKIIEQYRAALVLRADAGRGRAVFTRACAACHRRGDEGLEIGPNLATVILHPPEKLLVSILDPNADILPGFQRYNCLLTTGEVLSGLMTAETSNSVTLKLADGRTQTLARTEIELLQNSNLSLMPEELEKIVSLQELADLIAFLRTP